VHQLVLLCWLVATVAASAMLTLTFTADIHGQGTHLAWSDDRRRVAVRNPPAIDRIGDQSVDVIRLVRTVLEHVTAVLCGGDPRVTGNLPGVEQALCALRREVEDHALAIGVTRAGPLVVDLRTIVAAAHVNADAECIAELVRRLAEIARSRPSRPPVPIEVQAIVCRMGQICVEIAAMAADAAASARTGALVEMDPADAELHRLQQLLYRLLLTDPDAVEVDAALDATLASRYYLGCAERAVSMARHAAFLAGSDAL
jgi:phosphate transport system protein